MSILKRFGRWLAREKQDKVEVEVKLTGYPKVKAQLEELESILIRISNRMVELEDFPFKRKE